MKIKTDWSIEALEKKYFITFLSLEFDNVDSLKNSMNKALIFLSNIGFLANTINEDLEYPSLNLSDEQSVDLFWNNKTSLLINFSDKLGSCGFSGNSEIKGTIKGKFPINFIRYDLLYWLIY